MLDLLLHPHTNMAHTPTLNPNVRQRALRELQNWRQQELNWLQQERNRGLAPRISSFQPHHSITVRAPDLLLAHKFRPVLLDYVDIQPQRVTERHDPLDQIVFHQPTTVNQGRRDRVFTLRSTADIIADSLQEENAFTTIAAVSSTTPISDEEFTALGRLPHTTAHDFWNYLHAVQAWPGETLLRVLTCANDEDYTALLQRTVSLTTVQRNTSFADILALL